MHRYKSILSTFHKELSTKIGYPGSSMSTLYGHINKDSISISAYGEGNKIINNEAIGILPGSLAEIFTNNAGNPWKESESDTITLKDLERETLEILGKYFGLDKDTTRGYITSGGTESNLASMWWSKLWLQNKNISSLEALIQQKKECYDHISSSADKKNKDLISYVEINQYIEDLSTPIIFCSKEHTHYSIEKICSLMKLNLCPINYHENGSIDLKDLEVKVKSHITYHPKKSIIMVANIGTTVTGAIDDVKAIKSILENHTSEGQITPYTIHADAACYGMIVPVTKPFGEIQNYFHDLGINTMTISGHKFLGTNVLGIALTTRQFLEESFTENSRISYCGNIEDITISGCRAGINTLWLHNTLMHLQLDKSYEIIKKIVHHNLANAEYLYKKLSRIVGRENTFWNPGQFNVIFPRPSLNLIQKYKLMPAYKNQAVICTQVGVHKKLIDQFIEEYNKEIQELFTHGKVCQ